MSIEQILMVITAIIATVSAFLYPLSILRMRSKTPKIPVNDGPEPEGYDLSQKDWDDPQWLQPPYLYGYGASGVRSHILTPNEARELDSVEYDVISSLKDGPLLIISRDPNIRYVKMEPPPPDTSWVSFDWVRS